MASNNQFAEYITKDLLGHIPDITARAMFGGFGLYKNGKIFGMIAEDILYFKVGETNKADYVKLKSKPFTYPGPNGKPYEMSYWEVPQKIQDDKELLKEWVTKSLSQHGKSKTTKSRNTKAKKPR